MKIVDAKKVLTAIENASVSSDPNSVKLIKEARRVFISHYSRNPKQFIEDFVVINDGSTNERIPFKLNAAQELVVEALKTNRYIAAPKARQLGITTLTNALALHHALFVKSAIVICMAVNTNKAKGNLRIIKRMFTSLPTWVQSVLVNYDVNNKNHTDNQDRWAFTALATKTEVSLSTSSASAENAARGDTPTFLHWTETAFAEEAEDIFTAIFPGLSRKKDSVIILESTGNGANGFYFEVCTGARKGFKVIFMPWHIEDKYAETGEELTERDRIQIADLMGVEDIPKYLSDDQLRWFKTQSGLMGKAKGQQEFPLTVEQVFQATSSSFFNQKTIDKVKRGMPEFYFDLDHNLLTVKEAGPGMVFYPVNEDFEYILSADTSEGRVDPSSISVFNPQGEEVAHWLEYMDSDKACDVIYALARYYNDANVIIENNGVGEYVIRRLKTTKFYSNIYNDGKADGINSNSATKPVWIQTLQNKITEDSMVFNNHYLQNEMRTFDAEKLQCPKGSHDDVVISSAIGAWLFHLQPPLIKVHTEYFREYNNELKQKSRRLVCY